MIGVDDVVAHLAVFIPPLVQFLVRLVFEIMKAHLSPFADRLIQQFDIIKKLFVVGLVLRHTGDVLHARLEVDIGEG